MYSRRQRASRVVSINSLAHKVPRRDCERERGKILLIFRLRRQTFLFHLYSLSLTFLCLPLFSLGENPTDTFLRAPCLARRFAEDAAARLSAAAASRACGIFNARGPRCQRATNFDRAVYVSTLKNELLTVFFEIGMRCARTLAHYTMGKSAGKVCERAF